MPSSFLKRVAAQLVGIVGRGRAAAAGADRRTVVVGHAGRCDLPLRRRGRRPLGGSPVEIANVRASLTTAQIALLDEAGTILAASTAAIAAAVKAAAANATTLLLAYLPDRARSGGAGTQAREFAGRAGRNRRSMCCSIEDYRVGHGQAQRTACAQRGPRSTRGSAIRSQSSIICRASSRTQRIAQQWRPIVDAAARGAGAAGCAEVFVWALPAGAARWPDIIRRGGGGDAIRGRAVPDRDRQRGERGADIFDQRRDQRRAGIEARNANWSQARLRFDAGPGVRGDAELETAAGLLSRPARTGDRVSVSRPLRLRARAG